MLEIFTTEYCKFSWSDNYKKHPVNGKKKHILILDGETKAALACVRSLGQAGYKISAASHTVSAIARSSKYCANHFICPDPMRDRDSYLKWIHEVVSGFTPDLLLPLTDVSLGLCLSIEALLRDKTRLPFCSYADFQIISNKAALATIASRAAIKSPQTYVIDLENTTLDLLEQEIRTFNYPAVLKPNSSVSAANSHFVKLPVVYPKNSEDVINFINEITKTNNKPIKLLLQEKIIGQGVGLFTLCSNGIPLIYFAHHRILEKPPSGGRSVLSESISTDIFPLTEVNSLLKTLNYNGVCMLEFKLCNNGDLYLMEINPRFWGSLQLSIDCKVNFPLLLSKLALEGNASIISDINSSKQYKIGQRLRCPFGTIDHALIRIKTEPIEALIDITLKNSLKILSNPANTKLESFRLNDIWPFFMETRNYMCSIFSGE